MNRREFVGAAVGTALLKKLTWAQELPDDLKVSRVIGFDLHTRRVKHVGKNAVRGDHGAGGMDRMVRLETNTGHQAIGRCWRDQKDVEQLLGKNPFNWFDENSLRFISPLGRRTMVLWDLAGKVLKKPVYRLLGGEQNQPVPVYDGSFYFSDLMPPHANRWEDRFKEELDDSLERGHRAIKVKIGRGHQWMDQAAGDERDIAVLQLLRKHAGDDILIGVDANNSMTPESARTFVVLASDLKLAFLEEPFREDAHESRALKEFIASKGLKMLLADGEGVDDEASYQQLVNAKAVDILQGDMYSLGIEGIRAEAAMGEPAGIQIAPHNWSSLLSLFMQVHTGLSVPNFYRAEMAPLSTDVLTYDGYRIRNGRCSVPDAPGFGLSVDEEKFSRVKVNFDLRT